MSENPNDSLRSISPIISGPFDLCTNSLAQRTYSKGEIIIQRGQRLNAAYFLKKGKAKHVITTINGEERISFYSVGPCLIGEVPFLTGFPPYVDTVACEKSTVQLLTREELFLNCNWETLYTTLALKLRSQAFLIEGDCLAANERICRFLYVLSITSSNNILKITQKEIADITGLHRITVNEVIKDLENRQAISKSRGTIRLLDAEGIKILSGLGI